MSPNFPQLFQHARDAAAAGDFQAAQKLYEQLWESPAWHQDADVQLSYAYSCERTGDYTQALELYKILMQHHINTPGLIDEQELADESMQRLHDLMADGGEVELDPVVDPHSDAAEARLIERLFKFGYERDLSAGEILCHYGEPAAHMWLLQEGSMDVVLPHHSINHLTAEPERPCLMGELAYFTGMRRSATLCCATPGKAIELSYERLQMLLQEDEELYQMMEYLFRHRLVLRVLSKHHIFKLFNELDRKRLTRVFESTVLKPGQSLMNENEEHPNAYMVQGGILILLEQKNGEEKLLGSVHPGDFFHLGGLLRGHSSPYKIVSGTPCHLLRLPRYSFEPFMLQRPWLIKAILKHARLSPREQVLHPEPDNLWAANRYIEMKK